MSERRPKRDRQPAGDRRFLWPSWLASAVFHAVLLVALGLAVEPRSRLPGDSPFPTTVSLSFSEQDAPPTLDSLTGPQASLTVLAEEPRAEAAEPVAEPAEALAALLPPELPTLPRPELPPGTTQDDAPAEMSGQAPPASGAARRAGPQALSSILGQTRTGVFGIEAVGQKFVYVFDRSASMSLHNGGPLAAAKAQLLGSLQDLGRTNQFQIIFYNDRLTLFDDSGRLIFGTEEQKRQAERFVRTMSADGATRHEEALAAALRMGPDVIFFLTDADHPQLSEAQLARLGRLNGGAQIHAIEFGLGPSYGPPNFLRKLAERNRGQYVYVDVLKLLAGRR